MADGDNLRACIRFTLATLGVTSPFVFLFILIPAGLFDDANQHDRGKRPGGRDRPVKSSDRHKDEGGSELPP